MELAALLTRRPSELKNLEELKSVPIFDTYGQGAISFLKNEVDVAVLCGGSKTDLPKHGPFFAQAFNTVDSFDTHNHIAPYIDEKTQQKMKGYFKEMDDLARATGHTSAISIGWDPGTFTVEKIMATAFFPVSRAYAFYGLNEKGGLSMGHSDAVRRVKGVADARQYTHAIPKAIERVRKGENPDLKAGDMHWRECFVVAKPGEDLARIKNDILEEPDYFKPYRTVVNFVSQEELNTKYSAMPHDGVVIAIGETSPGKKFKIEYNCQWDSNPEATGHIMLAHARAVHRLNKEGRIGAFRPIDIASAYLHPSSFEELTKRI
ncbi:MAG: diaminopimelate dehydrogenase [Candidatus Aenigmarchaeota archaeon]|nr:diaminopimelate dehydrogenase [Candidatus Aenigmarchaeota archaeon]